MAMKLPNLPFASNALEPHMSARTFEFHHGKHHAAYVTNGNKLLEGTPLEKKALHEVIREVAGDSAKAGVFNNVAQVWNHSFFWHCLKPGGGGQPSGDLAKQIDAAFGSYDQFVQEFSHAAATQFGSGWAWLVKDGGKLAIVKTPNADTPVARSQQPLLTLDVWEHAYYLDHQNARPKFIETFLTKLVNWDYVAQNLAQDPTAAISKESQT
jgi:Fe-Mn family superoxide dismutase